VVDVNKGDIFDDLAALHTAMPESVGGNPQIGEDVLGDAQEQVRHEREEHAEQLRLLWDEQDVDPVLSEIRAARAAMLAAEQRLHLLIAFAREYVSPRPYPLEEIATAAGMSISGVRTCYDEEEVAVVAQLTGRKPRSRNAQTPAARRRMQRRDSSAER
jgi:hypothetical protein